MTDKLTAVFGIRMTRAQITNLEEACEHFGTTKAHFLRRIALQLIKHHQQGDAFGWPIDL